MFLIDYVKSVVANRFTLLGYLLLLVCFLMPHSITYLFTPVMILAAAMLGATHAAFPTVSTYRRTKKHIRLFGRIDERFAKSLSSYCDRIGMMMAAKEFDIELYFTKRATYLGF